jgi:hypothetical protein
MRKACLALTALAGLSGGRLSAQVSLSAGARYTTALVRDEIVNPIAVRATIGPAVALTLRTPAPRGWGGEAIVDLGLAELRREEAGARVGLGALTTVALAVAVRREWAPGVAARVGAGGLVYRPERDAGVFGRGVGGVFPLGLAAVSWRLPWLRHYALAVEARYDVHRFITPALRAAGFTDGRAVHRVALGLSAGLR